MNCNPLPRGLGTEHTEIRVSEGELSLWTAAFRIRVGIETELELEIDQWPVWVLG